MKKQLAILMAIVFIDLGFTNCSSIFCPGLWHQKHKASKQ